MRCWRPSVRSWSISSPVGAARATPSPRRWSRSRQERAGEVEIVKLDVDANPETTNRFAIKSLPTLMLFKAGQPVATQVGALPKARLRAWLAELA